MKVTKAIIATGGFGTRLGVAAISTEKCMALVDGKPVLQYVVEDCVAAGIEDITFIVGSMSHQTRTHFGGNPGFEEYLAAKGKTDLLAEAKRVRTMANYTFVEQRPDHPYGTSVPLWLARAAIPASREKFLYLFGDQLYHHSDGTSEAANLIERTARAGTHAGMLAMEVPPETIDRYGIVTTRPLLARDGTPIMDQIIEKPAVGSVNSNRNNGSFFLLNRDVLSSLEANIMQPPEGSPEHYFTDVMNTYAADGNSVAVIEPTGTYLDCGNKDALLIANNFVAAVNAAA
ncbi:MAG TPA: sugar phosphate nucleotidyltransferase [Candidatus Saccharimonadales bacterium]|jgi:UTP--glucose-1-phosphate uridylyltransferase|nr:sugar phosphate nucleotidyltransferase [Candidatus Saccharimonadales bacterium]